MNFRNISQWINNDLFIRVADRTFTVSDNDTIKFYHYPSCLFQNSTYTLLTYLFQSLEPQVYNNKFNLLGHKPAIKIW